MKTRLTFALAAFVALLALAAGAVRPPADVRVSPSTGDDFQRPAAGQLPRGFTLPATDVNLTVSSLVTADLDADGDLDIIAADRSNGNLGIVVWVNDGAGRLTRKAPARSTGLAGEPASPTLEGHEGTTAASMQPNGPVAETIAADPRLTLPVQSYEQRPAANPASTASSALRSRSPPVCS